jgi:hypothetical protein
LGYNGWVRLLLFATGSGIEIFYSYEFASNESVNALTCVSLETTSTESGSKNFIAVGTTINRGEDLAVKGAVCFPAAILFSANLFRKPDIYF